MPTYPLLLPDNTRVRLTAVPWQCLVDLVTRLANRSSLQTWLPRDVFPEAATRGRPRQRLLRTLAAHGVLVVTAAGYRRPETIQAQVQAALPTTPGKGETPCVHTVAPRRTP